LEDDPITLFQGNYDRAIDPLENAVSQDKTKTSYQFPDWKYTLKASDGYGFTAPVGKFKPNAFGLYDMQGNASQWCVDWYGPEYYAASPADNPTGTDSGNVRVLRGGSWCTGPYGSRSADRDRGAPDCRLNGAGFRVARTQ
jgi:formylglycine-generating enzyme